MNINENRAVIFMATYNGEKYIQEQLESISNQTFKDWDLIISDDGSTDHTVDIAKEYAQNEQHTIKIIENNGKHGAYLNFYNAMRWLLKQDENPYLYFFYCDQDDIWMPDKMEKEIQALQKIEDLEIDKPVVCYSDLQIIDAEGIDTGKKLSDFTDIRLNNPYNIFFSHRYIWGTTMAHNRVLWDKMELPDDITNDISHDCFLPKYAAAFGEVVYIDEPLVRYRRHGNNVSAVPHSYNFLSGTKRALSKMPTVIKNHAKTYNASMFFLDHTTKYEPNEFTQKLRTCLECGGIEAVSFARKFHINTANNFYNRAAFYLILLTGAYKHDKSWGRSE